MGRVVVDVMPKPEILDPQGKAVTGALGRLGFRGISVRQGKRFEGLPERTMTTSTTWTGWTDEQLAGITAPVLIVQGDRDFTLNAHAALMQELIPGSQLAVLPGTTHMQATRRADLLLPMLAAFLD